MLTFCTVCVHWIAASQAPHYLLLCSHENWVLEFLFTLNFSQLQKLSHSQWMTIIHIKVVLAAVLVSFCPCTNAVQLRFCCYFFYSKEQVVKNVAIWYWFFSVLTDAVGFSLLFGVFASLLACPMTTASFPLLLRIYEASGEKSKVAYTIKISS